MIIPIELESNLPLATISQNRAQPRNTFPISVNKSRHVSEFGDILIPTLSKYFKLCDSTKRDFGSLLAKEHPLTIETFQNNGDKYVLKLNVQKFRPEEIHVKITDGYVSIYGAHQTRSDEQNYSRQEFLRRYLIPDGVNADDVSCELSSDGYLLISASHSNHKVKITELQIPLELVGVHRNMSRM